MLYYIVVNDLLKNELKQEYNKKKLIKNKLKKLKNITGIMRISK
jgi:hypothetical protein